MLRDVKTGKSLWRSKHWWLRSQGHIMHRRETLQLPKEKKQQLRAGYTYRPL